ncbi:MAG: phosphate transport system permease protein [Solirubrobacterales bacterium]|jgi:phosphate transport system permease protein|nr:phosphate transport system permease protein [Solirubrobacterales bacterium]
MEAHSTAPGHPLLGGGGNLRRRRRTNQIVQWASTVAALLAVAVLVLVVGSVAVHGASAISFSFLTNSGAGQTFGAVGSGIGNSIVGTLLLIAMAALMAVPIGLLIAIYTSEFAGPRVSNVVRFALDILNGIPTIVVGIFIFGLLVVAHGQSAIAGSIALAIVMLPIVARTAQEVLALVPSSLKEGAAALGVARWRTVLRVVLPTAAGGLLTGALLAVARVAGETAPLLLVCGIEPPIVSTDVTHAVASLPVTIFVLSEQPLPAAHDQAWATALVLILFVLLLNVVARFFHSRSRKRLGG